MKSLKLFFLILITIIFIFSCKQKKIIFETKQTGYLVTKIDSINQYYLIYASKNEINYKIISPKKNNDNCENIIEGKSYVFLLYSAINRIYTIGGKTIIPHDSTYCLELDSVTKICIEPRNGIYDLHFCDNLKGLCLSK